MSLPLEDYAMLSDCHSAALVSRFGSIDWLCFPRFDSPALFAALLGNKENGCWVIQPETPFRSSRKYIEGTTVLETTFETEQGSCVLTDCLIIGGQQPTLVRYVKGLSGKVSIKLELFLRFDYGSIVPWVKRLNENSTHLQAIAGPDALVITSTVPLKGRDLHTEVLFKLHEGESQSFSIIWHQSWEMAPSPLENALHSIRKTTYWWKEWNDRSTYQGLDKSGVDRSLITLKALTYEPTGGIVAAPTTSLPEWIGGNRNWDYRFCWLRDATFALYSLLTAGYREEAQRWRQWLLRSVAGTPEQVNIMYSITGERRLQEIEIPWLEGYENSKPVRIGNAAAKQWQLDVFGEIMDTFELAARSGLKQDQNAWLIQLKMLECVANTWAEPDEGIWEVRGSRRQFTHSKVMAWVAVDRAIKAAQKFKLNGPIKEWEVLRDRIHMDVCAKGFNSKLNSFTQYYGGTELDASLLMIGLVGFLPADDPRLLGTIRAIEVNLMDNGLLHRYSPNSSVDGLSGSDGTFLACSFWLADNYVLTGNFAKANELFQYLVSLRNDVGLFAEEYAPEHKCLVGNFPQAFTHIAHINTASNLSEAKGPANDRSARS